MEIYLLIKVFPLLKLTLDESSQFSFFYCNACFMPQDKRLKLSLNGNRKIVGTLRGYDAFLNVVIEDAEGDGGTYLGQLVIRGNSIVQFEALERVN